MRPVAPEYFVVIDRKQQGPFDAAALRGLVQTGDLTDRTYVWRSGMNEWVRAKDVSALRDLLHPKRQPAVSAPTRKRPPPPKLPAAKPAAGAFEPFGGEDGQLEFGEQTRFFIAQAGMNRRNPPWKKALFVVLLVGVPAGALSLLTMTRVVPLEITSVDEAGNEVTTPVFSRQGMTGLGDLLLGRTKKTRAAKKRAALAAKADERTPLEGASDTPVLPVGDPSARQGAGPALAPVDRAVGPAEAALRAHYEDSRKRDLGPERRAVVTPVRRTEEGGPSAEEIQRVIAQVQPGFQLCIEQELKKNPGFRGGKVHLRATVASSGTVTAVAMDSRELDTSPLGGCLKMRARRMVFSAFEGDAVDVEIPLILSRSL